MKTEMNKKKNTKVRTKIKKIKCVKNSQGEVAKFGYRSERKVEKFKNPAIF
jgi:hypothetical protein